MFVFEYKKKTKNNKCFKIQFVIDGSMHVIPCSATSIRVWIEDIYYFE